MTKNWLLFLNITTKDHQLNGGSRNLLFCFPESLTCLGDKTLNDYLSDRYKEEYQTVEKETFNKIKNQLFSELKFSLGNGAGKLNRLYSQLTADYITYQSTVPDFSALGLTNIHKEFPLEIFRNKICKNIQRSPTSDSDISLRPYDRGLDILQTFAPNLGELKDLIVESLIKEIPVRICLIWSRSRSAQIREAALTQYASIQSIDREFSIEAEARANLEIIEDILRLSPTYINHLKVRMYDSFPSISIYRTNNYLLRGTFLHTQLAIKSSQLELDLSAGDPLLAKETMMNFEIFWKMGRDFSHALVQSNWHNDLITLF
jgi:hypothetical protein